MAQEKATGTQAIDRALALLSEVLDAHDPLTLSELAARTHLAKGTASRMLAALERSGMVGRAHSGGFEPGSVLNGFAIRGGAYSALIEAATPAMQRVAHHTHETVSLAVAAPGGLNSIAQVDGTYLLGSRNWVGEFVPLHCSAAGKVLMAFGAAHIPDVLPARTPETITDRARLDQELAVVRERGFATIRNELEPGLTSVAVAVRDPQGHVVAAMSVTAPGERLTEQLEVSLARAMSTALNDSVSPSREGAA
jgi:DNA-binding IclR family transcriptional regulator